MHFYDHVIWDISGVCNAQCVYCSNGGRCISGNEHKKQAGFLAPRDFSNALAFLKEKGIIIPGRTFIDLFNWGEAFLHPDFETMLEIVTDMNFAISLSTNASTLKLIPAKCYWRLCNLAFSVPGFSQESYDRIHGFNFNTVCKNIAAISAPIRHYSPGTEITMTYHEYKWNSHEKPAARNFCVENDIHFKAWPAVLMSVNMFQEQLGKNLDKDLYAFQYKQIDENAVCAQYSQLVIDEYCNIVQCCMTDLYSKDHVVGSLYDVDFDNLVEQRTNAQVCSTCKSLKVCYLKGLP